jgi:hypothetical protein
MNSSALQHEQWRSTQGMFAAVKPRFLGKTTKITNHTTAHTILNFSLAIAANTQSCKRQRPIASQDLVPN